MKDDQYEMGEEEVGSCYAMGLECEVMDGDYEEDVVVLVVVEVDDEVFYGFEYPNPNVMIEQRGVVVKKLWFQISM